MDNIFRFAHFVADRVRYQLRRETGPVKLERIPLELLFLLLENRGKLVPRQQIVARLWGSEVFLDTERSINTAVRKIRRALEDDPHHPQFIETVVGQGYRFIAPLVQENAIQDPQREVPVGSPTASGRIDIEGTDILLRSFVVETARGQTVLTCDVVVSNIPLGRVKLLELELPGDVTLPLKPQDRLLLDFHGVRASLTANAAQALHAFSVSVLKSGLRTRVIDTFQLSEEPGQALSLQLAKQAVMGPQG